MFTGTFRAFSELFTRVGSFARCSRDVLRSCNVARRRCRSCIKRCRGTVAGVGLTRPSSPRAPPRTRRAISASCRLVTCDDAGVSCRCVVGLVRGVIAPSRSTRTIAPRRHRGRVSRIGRCVRRVQGSGPGMTSVVAALMGRVRRSRGGCGNRSVVGVMRGVGRSYVGRIIARFYIA